MLPWEWGMLSVLGGSRAGIGKLWPMAQIRLLPVFVNKILLECSHIHWFMYCLWLLYATAGWEVARPTKPKIFAVWPFRGNVCWPLCSELEQGMQKEGWFRDPHKNVLRGGAGQWWIGEGVRPLPPEGWKQLLASPGVGCTAGTLYWGQVGHVSF